MILDAKSKVNNIFIGDTKNEKYKILANSKMFSILSSKLYTDKVLAPIRELLCNAYDAHVAAGRQDTAIEVGVPTQNNAKFKVRDFGNGLSPEDMLELYTTYGASTKNLSNDFIGCMGLGSKSPFAYTDTFTAVSRHKGKRYSFACSLDNGSPNITQFPTVDMGEGERSGLEIEFPVNSGDCTTFQSKIWDFNRCFVGKLAFVIDPADKRQACYYRNWDNPDRVSLDFYKNVAMVENSHGAVNVLMGGVLYSCAIPEFSSRNFPLTHDQFSSVTHAIRNRGSYTFVIKAELGSVDIAASREHCEMTSKTSNYVLTCLYNYLSSVEKDFLDELNKHKLSDYEYCSRYADFLKTKPFLSSDGLNKKIESCFNLRAYDDVEAAAKELAMLDEDWTILWSAQNGSKRDKSLLKLMPKTLNTGAPRGSDLRYGSSKLKAMQWVVNGRIKFLQVPEDRKSAVLPPQTFAKFPEKAEVIMIRDDKQCDYLRSKGIEVVKSSDLPKPERTKTASTSAEKTSTPRVVKTEAQKLLKNFRIAFGGRSKFDINYAGSITDVSNLGGTGSSRAYYYSAEQLDKIVAEDKLVLLPVVYVDKAYLAHTDWLADKFKPATKIKAHTVYVKSTFTALIQWLRDAGYLVMIKEYSSSNTADGIQQDLEGTCKALGCSTAEKLIAKLFKSPVFSDANFVKAQKAHVAVQYITRFVLDLPEQCSILKKAATACATKVGLDKKLIGGLFDVDVDSVSGAALIVGSWINQSDDTVVRSTISDNYFGMTHLNTTDSKQLTNDLAKLDKQLSADFPLVTRVCAWEKTFTRAFWQAVSGSTHNEKALISYIEAMIAYNKKEQKVSSQN